MNRSVRHGEQLARWVSAERVSPITYDLAVARVIVYIDGFNLYHGVKEFMQSERNLRSWKWLDIVELSRRLVPKDDVRLVRYFTAKVQSLAADPAMAQRQQAYLRAVSADPKVSVHFGKFMVQKKRMPLIDPPGRFRLKLVQLLGVDLKSHSDGNVSASVLRIEEKGTDVSLGAHLVADAFRGEFDKALVISNDTDLCEPVRIVVAELGRDVIVANPRGHREPANALRKVATETRQIRTAVLFESQLPESVDDEHGSVSKPLTW